MSNYCPKCNSHAPKLHPTVQYGGEVQICTDPFHVTNDFEQFLLAERTLIRKQLEAAERALQEAAELHNADEQSVRNMQRLLDESFVEKVRLRSALEQIKSVRGGDREAQLLEAIRIAEDALVASPADHDYVVVRREEWERLQSREQRGIVGKEIVRPAFGIESDDLSEGQPRSEEES